MLNVLVTAKLARALIQLVRNPSRLEVVFDLSDALRDDKRAISLFETTVARPEIAPACNARLQTPLLDLAVLDTMPEGSLGRVTSAFFRRHGLDPAALPRPEVKSDYDWLNAHLYETHDLWHIVTGFEPDVAGEVGLQAFYAAQLGGPFPLIILIAGLLNSLLFAPAEASARIAAIARGWRIGAQAKTFIGVDWSVLLPLPLEAVRAKLNVQLEPAVETVATPARICEAA